jgi:hypothetical protein
MNIKLILFSVVLAVVGFGAVFYWELNKGPPDRPPLVESSSSPDAITPFEQKMLKGGYSRDHQTHRWYSRYEAYADNGCAIYGPPWDATFNCRTPLTPNEGVPDQQ